MEIKTIALESCTLFWFLRVITSLFNFKGLNGSFLQLIFLTFLSSEITYSTVRLYRIKNRFKAIYCNTVTYYTVTPVWTPAHLLLIAILWSHRIWPTAIPLLQYSHKASRLPAHVGNFLWDSRLWVWLGGVVQMFSVCTMWTLPFYFLIPATDAVEPICPKRNSKKVFMNFIIMIIVDYLI